MEQSSWFRTVVAIRRATTVVAIGRTTIGRVAVVAFLAAVVLGLVGKYGRPIARKIGADAWRRRYDEPP